MIEQNKFSEKDVEILVEAAKEAGRQRADFLKLLDDPDLAETKKFSKRFTVEDLFAGKTTWSKHKIWEEQAPVFEKLRKEGWAVRKTPESYSEWLRAPAFEAFWAERQLRETAEGKLREISRLSLQY